MSGKRLASERDAGGTLARRVTRRVSLGWILALLVLPTFLGVTPAAGSDEFGRIREKAAEMASAVQGNYYDTFGEGKDSGLSRTYGDYGYLLTPKKIEDVRKLLEEATTPEERALRERTLSLLTLHSLHSMSAPLIDNARDAMRDNVVRVEDDRIVLRGLDFAISLAEDQDTRRKWSLAASQLYTGTNVYLLNMLVDLDRHAKELGLEGYYSFLRSAEGWDIDLLTAATESLLVSTDSTYSAGLDKWSQHELGLEARRVRTYDAVRLMMLPALKAKMSWGDPLDVAKQTFKDLGFNLDDQRTMRIDVKARPGQRPGAFAYQLAVGKCRVSATPHEYPSLLPELLGALGEAQFYQNMPGDLAFENAFFGNSILPNVYRALFESIAEEPAWIGQHLKLNGVTAEEVAEAFRFRRLLKMREAAGNQLFQLELHKNFQIDPAKYNEIMERALLWKRVENDKDAYLVYNDDYQSGGYVLGAILAAQIRDALRAEWGAEWFRNPELGKRLTAMARQGYGFSLNDLLSYWSLDGVKVQALLARAE
ncbi:MAG: hypothetical protein V1774_12220 [Candidatus Eisenbacteria bacterium]